MSGNLLNDPARCAELERLGLAQTLAARTEPGPTTPVRSTALPSLPDYELLRAHGSGSHGLVYEALERATGRRVALKTVSGGSGVALLRLKQELRGRADVDHPNLARLYGLSAHEGQVYLAMEFVQGSDFASHVRERAAGGGPLALEATLRGLLRQLVPAIAALHEAGKLHRDIKADNVLVTDAGRVVVLDFGLLRDRRSDASQDLEKGEVVGTPAYIAPELVAGKAPTCAADWYSLGVLIHVCLTGRFPFGGSVINIITAKLEQDAPGLGRAFSPAMRRLCAELLDRDPARRPDAATILQLLGEDTALPVSRAAPMGGELLGRAEEREMLSGCWSEVRAGGRAHVHLHGPRGVGKTSLSSWLCDAVGGAGLVLRGRCIRGDQMPLGVVDTLVDSLATVARSTAPDVLDSVDPGVVAAVTRRFPALDGLSARETATGGMGMEPIEALRDLLSVVAASHPLLVVLDDVQWIDPDSQAALGRLFGGNGPARTLVITCSDRATAPASLAGGRCRRLTLGGLSSQDVARLLAGTPLARDPELVQQVALESEGNPLYVAELARALTGDRAAPCFVDGRPSLQRMLVDRIRALPAAARRLLQVTSLSEGPVELLRALEAAGVGPGGSVLAQVLESSGLARSVAGAPGTCLEPAHRQVRAAALRTIRPSLACRLRRALAAA